MLSFRTRHQSLLRMLKYALAVAPFFLSAAIANAQTPPADSSSTSSSSAHPRIALTFDDLPAHGPLPPGETRAEIATKILAGLRDAHVPPTYGFVNGATLESEPQDLPVLQAWRAAGNPLGNHTWSHMNLDQNSLEDFEANVTRNEPLLRKMMDNEDWHWFRFPYLAEGYTPAKHDGIRAFLAEHGYKIADVTMSFADYLWNDPYARCVAEADTVSIAQLQSTYLAAAASNFDFYRRLSQSLYKRDIPYVLLMHIGAFDAEMLPKLLELYRSRGVQFITLPEAERDPFYRVDSDPKLPPAPEDLEAAMLKRKISVPAEPVTTIQFDSLCR
jgi:peptidoglycan/xylan/chitin deacetylase (PgdA/CDA1 family)